MGFERVVSENDGGGEEREEYGVVVVGEEGGGERNECEMNPCFIIVETCLAAIEGTL